MDAAWTSFRESEASTLLDGTIRRGQRIRKPLQPGDDDIQTLFALRMHQDLVEVDGRLERLQALGCIAWDDDDYPQVTSRGMEALRHWLS